MPYRWNDSTFENFADAAKAWLSWWSTKKTSCSLMAKNLIEMVDANTPEEWKEKALNNIERYHCDRCGIYGIITHEIVINKLLKEIEEV